MPDSASDRGAAEVRDVAGIAVRLTSPGRVMFPVLGDSGGRKADLFSYYVAVATHPSGALMTALRERPCHLQRFPDGIDGDEVYQKRVPAKAPAHISTCRVTFPSGRQADAFGVHHPADVAWAVQMSTVTFHPWHTRCPDNDHPDEWRIDLDPQPGTGFAQARRVALDGVRPLLAELGLAGYPKTSGGRGIHVYVRIEPRWDFVQVRRSAIAFARELERRLPRQVTAAWWKEERGERIFVDINQNARDRTIAGAYSARRTPRATVSTPVTWDELADVEPDDCTIATVPALLDRRGDPMSGIDATAHSLDVLLDWVERDEAAGLGDMPYPPSYPKMPGEPMRVQPSRARHRDPD